MPRVAEEEEQMLGGQQQPTACMARQQPPSLPCPPPGLGLEQLKRRHIVASLVHSENNYVTSLQRLVNVSCVLHQICHFSMDVIDLAASVFKLLIPLMIFSGLQKTIRRKQSTHFEFNKGSSSISSSTRNFTLSHTVSNCFIRSNSQLG